jgi:hypothetical protein
MALTLIIRTGWNLTGGPPFFTLNPTSISLVLAGSHVYTNTLSIPTTAGGTLLPVGASLTPVGWALFQNLDPTNYLQIGVQVAGTFYPLLRLMPGDPPQSMRLDGLTVYALAHTAACNLQYTIFDA